MESRCIARYVRIAPRKMRLVANLVRGKNVNEAISMLQFTEKAAAEPTLKAIKSAVANIANSDNGRDVNLDTLIVKTIFVDEGPTMKRFMPRAMGRATPIRKRMSHLTVHVASPVETVVVQPASAIESEALKKTKTVKKTALNKADKTTTKRPVKKKAK